MRKILDVIPSSYGSSPLRGEYVKNELNSVGQQGSSPLRGEYVDDAGGAVDEIGSSPLRGEYLDEIIQSL